MTHSLGFSSKAHHKKLCKPLNEIVTEWLVCSGFEEETIRGYGRDVRRFLKEQLMLDGMCLKNLVQVESHFVYKEAREYLASFKKFEENGHVLKNPHTLNRIRNSLCSFFNYLVRYYQLPINPLMDIKLLETAERSNTSDLTEKELLKFLEFMKNEAKKSFSKQRNFLIALGLLIEGMRRKELANLTWDQVNLHDRYIRITQKGAREKLCPIPIEFLPWIVRYREKCNLKNPFVFSPISNNRGKDLFKPISTTYIYRIINETGRRVIPYKHITPHSFRATFATLGDQWKIPITWIANGGGWSDLRMPRYYIKSDVLKYNMSNVMAHWLHDNGII